MRQGTETLLWCVLCQESKPEEFSMERPTLPTMDVSSKWLQAVVLTFLFGFAILGYLAIRSVRAVALER